MSSKIRTRFAPSPTGFVHVGAIRTALFSWLLAKQCKGSFILRIEDTDQSREVEGAEKHIIKSLNKLGLNFDEGPSKEGDYGPYTQSARLNIYEKWAEKLIKSGRAYVDPYTSQEVQGFREEAQKNKKAFLFRDHRPENLDTSWNKTKPLRFKSEPRGYKWIDEIMGERSTGQEVIDDFILMKSDGFPTYNFAHIVDDFEMKISHVIRGQEFLSSTPNYLNLYEALGIEPPKIASVPPIMNEQGNKKLSKRDGAKDVLDYVNQGIPVEAFLNFIATMGWNDGTEQEVFTVQELTDKFSFDGIQRSGAKFDEKRLYWISGSHIRNMNSDQLYAEVEDYWPESAKSFNDSYKKKVLGLVQERLKFYMELPELSEFFFKDYPINSGLVAGHKQLKKFDSSELEKILTKTKDALNNLGSWTADEIQKSLNRLLEEMDLKPVVLFSLIRIATTQSPSSPPLAESMSVLGKDKVIDRINSQIEAFAS